MARVLTLVNVRTPPRWAGDEFGDDSILPGGAKVDPSLFFAEDSVKVVVDVAGAAANATTVPVLALSGPIPSGTQLHFGSKKFAILTVAAVAADVALTVEALPTALVSLDTATYPGIKEISLQSGILLGRTYAERDAGTPYGPAADSDDEFYLLAFDVTDANFNNDCELYRHTGLVKENYLPVFSTLSSAQKAKIRALYETTVGFE